MPTTIAPYISLSLSDIETAFESVASNAAILRRETSPMNETFNYFYTTGVFIKYTDL